MAEIGSKQVCKAAIEIALTETRDTENDKKNENMAMGIKSVAIDFGSDFFTAVP
ncbi:MAG: hut operon positive regulator HutP, partial [Clostridia bacterium]|nr:hut operon positive regulator HutP [Clostridia bacterium]